MASKEHKNVELSRLRAEVLFQIIYQTKSERTEELAQCPELLYKSTSESRFLLDEVFRDSQYVCETMTRAIKTANTWYTIFALTIRINEFLKKQNEQNDDYDQLFEAISRMAKLFWQVQQPAPYTLECKVFAIIEKVREDRVVLYNVIDDLQRIHQRG